MTCLCSHTHTPHDRRCLPWNFGRRQDDLWLTSVERLWGIGEFNQPFIFFFELLVGHDALCQVCNSRSELLTCNKVNACATEPLFCFASMSARRASASSCTSWAIWFLFHQSWSNTSVSAAINHQTFHTNHKMQRRRDRSKDNERQPLPLNLGFRAMGMNCHRGGQSRRQAWWNWHQGSVARIPVWDGHASLEGAATSARRREKRSPARSRRAPPHHFKSHKTPWCLSGLASSPSYGYILTCFGSAQHLPDSNGHFMRHHRCQIYTYIYTSDYTVDGTLPAAPTVLAKKSFRHCASGVAVALQQTAGRLVQHSQHLRDHPPPVHLQRS